MQAPRCPKCGKLVPADAPGEVCPACLLRLGFDTEATSPAPVLGAETIAASSQESVTDRLEPQTTSFSIPGYEILGELGRGGMGVVYKARHLDLKRLVALKMIVAAENASSDQIERLRREAEAVARLQHPNIVQIHEVGQRDGRPYLSLEFVEGGSLADKLRGTPLAPMEAARAVETLARAVHAAHQRGIVHRDLKPGNVLLTADGTPKIADFGLAKQTDAGSSRTQEGTVVGTPSYMAPEQASGTIQAVGPAADTYALGAILYEALTGRPPFRGVTALDTIMQVVSVEPAPPRSLQPQVPRDLETICLKCLHKDPDRRYASALELADDLRRFLGHEPVRARPTPALERLSKWSRRHPAGAALTLALASLVVLAFVFVTWRWRETERAAHLERKGKHDAEKLTEEANKRAEAEGQLAGEAKRRAEAEQKRREEVAQALEKAEQIAFSSVIWQAAGMIDSDPAIALRILEDPKFCPRERRDFNWRYQYQLGQRLVKRLARLDQGTYGYNSAISENGQWLAAVVDDQVHMWNLDADMAGVLVETGHGSDVATAITRDGKTLATGGADGLVKLWHLPDGTHRATLKWHIPDDQEKHRKVYALAFDPSGKKLAVGGAYYDDVLGQRISDARFRFFVVWIWDLDTGTGERLTSYEDYKDFSFNTAGVNYLTWSPDGKLLAIGTTRGSKLLILDPVSGALRHQFRPQAGFVGGMAFSPDSKLFAYGNSTSNVFVIDLARNQVRHTLYGHQSHVHRCAFTEDGSLLSGAYDGTIRVWDPGSGQLRSVLRCGDRVYGMGLRSRDKQVVALTSTEAQFWSLRVAAPAVTLDLRQEKAPRGAASPVAFDAEAGRFAVVGRDNQVRCWKVSQEIAPAESGASRWFASVSAKRESVLLGHKERTTAVAFGPAGSRLLAAGAEDGRILVWRLGDRPGDATPEPTVLNGAGPVSYLAVLPDGKSFLSGADTKGGVTVSLWNLEDRTAQPFSKELGKVQAISLSKDGKHLATVDSLGTTHIWDAGKRVLARTLPPVKEGKTPPPGDKGFLGVRLDKVGDQGVRIAQILPGGGAEKAGLKAKDVILQVGARKIAGLAALQGTMQGFKAGDEILVKVERGANELDIKVVLGAAPVLPVGSQEAAVGLAWNAAGTALATFVKGGVMVHDLKSGTSRQVTLGPHDFGFTGYMAITGDLKTVAAACVDRTVRLYDVDSGHLRGEIPVLSHHIFGLAFNRDATLLATVSLGDARWDGGGEIKLWAAAPP